VGPWPAAPGAGPQGAGGGEQVGDGASLLAGSHAARERHFGNLFLTDHAPGFRQGRHGPVGGPRGRGPGRHSVREGRHRHADGQQHPCYREVQVPVGRSGRDRDRRAAPDGLGFHGGGGPRVLPRAEPHGGLLPKGEDHPGVEAGPEVRRTAWHVAPTKLGPSGDRGIPNERAEQNSGRTRREGPRGGSFRW
jgi:hypothetical protein